MRWMRTWLPVRVERLWWMRRLRRLLRPLGALPLVLTRLSALGEVEVWIFRMRNCNSEKLREHLGKRLKMTTPILRFSGRTAH